MTPNGQPHVVFHRSAVKTPNSDDKKRNNKKKKKKKRRQHNSNCGTKEPKRSTETKIEWQPQGKVFKNFQNFFFDDNKLGKIPNFVMHA